MLGKIFLKLPRAGFTVKKINLMKKELRSQTWKAILDFEI